MAISTTESETFPRSERLLAMAIAAVTLAMRAVAFFHYRFDSDEPQHLHVVWGWTVGLLQYRDLFDNHAPLFHMAMAPLLGALGERSDILFYMRAPMIVFWLLVTFATFAIARRLYDVRVAIWATLLLNVFPTFFLKSLEFRTDNLWNACWMMAVAALVLNPRSTVLFFLTGLLLGCALSISLKTTLLLFTLAAAGVITYVMYLRERGIGISLRHLVALAAGLVIVPSLIGGYFAWRGAWHELVYCVFRFNSMVALTRSPMAVWWPRAIYVPLMVVLLNYAWKHRRTTTAWRFFFAVASGVFILTLGGFWILISPRDLLPILPFLAIFSVAALTRWRLSAAVMAALAIGCLLSTGYYAAWLANRTREFITMENQLLRLTRVGDPVIDYKGELIFRRRPYYFIFEYITRNAIAHGLINDTVPEDLVRTQCHVAQADGTQWPERARDFMIANYIDLGRLRASGQWLKSDGSFTIAVPGQYVILWKKGEADGMLDGTPYGGPRPLAAGPHIFKGVTAGARLACLWAPAFARGFTPFYRQDLDF